MSPKVVHIDNIRLAKSHEEALNKIRQALQECPELIEDPEFCKKIDELGEKIRTATSQLKTRGADNPPP